VYLMSFSFKTVWWRSNTSVHCTECYCWPQCKPWL